MGHTKYCYNHNSPVIIDVDESPLINVQGNPDSTATYVENMA